MGEASKKGCGNAVGVGACRSGAPSKVGELQLSSGGFMIPHPQKAAKGGEDSFYIAPSGRSFGIADGVSGWVRAAPAPARATVLPGHHMPVSLNAFSLAAVMSPHSVLVLRKCLHMVEAEMRCRQTLA